MNKKSLVRIGSIMLLVVILLSTVLACGDSEPAPAPAPAPAGPDEILIGNVSSLTGMYAAFGVGGTFGLNEAVQDINAQGGVYVKEFNRNIPVRVVTVDSQSDPIRTSSLAEDLVLNDEINFFVSPLEPPPSRSGVSVVADKYRIPNVGGTGPLESWESLRASANPPWKYSWISGYSIDTPATPGDIGYNENGFLLMPLYVEFMDKYADQTNKVVGVYAMSDSDGIGAYAPYHKVLQENGYTTVGEEESLGLFPPDTTDFTAIIKKWQDADAQILIGNCPAPHFGTMWRQSQTMNFQPKLIIAPRAALFYNDINSWGGDLPNAIITEWWWDPAFEDSVGIGDTTPQDLYDRWVEKTGDPMNQMIGLGYQAAQVIFEAIERAGTLDAEAVNTALLTTDMATIATHVNYDESWQTSRWPLFLCQWQKTDQPWVWESKVIYSDHDFIPVTGETVFPIPYD